MGFLFDEDESTPHIPASIDFATSTGIRLRLPLSPGYGSEYSHWFTTKDGCPSYLKFVDTGGTLHLVNCRNAGYRGHIKGGVATGILAADFAIEAKSPDEDFATFHALRSRVAGLHDFTGWRLSDVNFEPNADGTLAEAVIRTSTPPPLELGQVGRLRASLVPDWRNDYPHRHQTTLSEGTYFQTDSPATLPIEEHLAVHRHARDLIALAGWATLDFSEHMVQRTDNPERVMSGDPAGPVWRRIYTTTTLRAHPPDSRSSVDMFPIACPFHLKAIEPTAVAAWLNLDPEWKRVTRPLLRLLFAGSSAIEVALLQAGVSIEALAFLTAVKSGISRRTAREVTFPERIRTVATSLPIDLTTMVGDLDTWVTKANSAYRAVKHADRDLADPQESLLVAHTFILIVRLHLMKLIGVSDEVIRNYERHMDWWSLTRSYAERGFSLEA